MLFEVHYGKNCTIGKEINNPIIREMFEDIWKFEKVEAEN